jgi:flagellar protein FlaG
MNMQMTKISMDAGSYVQSTNAPERLQLIKGTRNKTEIKRQTAESAVPTRTGAGQLQPERENDPSEFVQTIEKANKRYEAYDKILQFSIHEDTNLIMIKIINTKTEEVIAEIPPEKILDMIAQLWEMAGLLVDKRA